MQSFSIPNHSRSGLHNRKSDFNNFCSTPTRVPFSRKPSAFAHKIYTTSVNFSKTYSSQLPKPDGSATARRVNSVVSHMDNSNISTTSLRHSPWKKPSQLSRPQALFNRWRNPDPKLTMHVDQEANLSLRGNQ